MGTKDIIEIANNAKDKSNKSLIESRDLLFDEFNKTKDLIVNLTKHLESVGELYEKINKEIGNRLI